VQDLSGFVSNVAELFTSTPDGLTNTRVSGTVVAGGLGVGIFTNIRAALLDQSGITEIIP
jgi:hypothetical protein